MTDTDKIRFILGRETSEYFQIVLENFAYPDSSDFGDVNWINERIKKIADFWVTITLSLELLIFRFEKWT